MNLYMLILALAASAAAWFAWRRYRQRPATESATEAQATRRRTGAGLVYAPPESGPRHFQPARPREESDPTGLSAFDIAPPPRSMGHPDND